MLGHRLFNDPGASLGDMAMGDPGRPGSPLVERLPVRSSAPPSLRGAYAHRLSDNAYHSANDRPQRAPNTLSIFLAHG